MVSYDTQAEAFHHEMVALVKKYQFRDRNEITCCGVSVSQCYVLELLHFEGALTMQKLAEQMHLSVSTITRVVEGLVKKGYVHREEDAKDRRVRRVRLTGEGEPAIVKGKGRGRGASRSRRWQRGTRRRF